MTPDASSAYLVHLVNLEPEQRVGEDPEMLDGSNGAANEAVRRRTEGAGSRGSVTNENARWMMVIPNSEINKL